MEQNTGLAKQVVMIESFKKRNGLNESENQPGIFVSPELIDSAKLVCMSVYRGEKTRQMYEDCKTSLLMLHHSDGYLKLKLKDITDRFGYAPN